jgi:cell wall-associated NlpC family hydrolase
MRLLILIILLALPTGASAMFEKNFERELMNIFRENPRYVMSGKIKPDAPTSEGIDCSRLFYLAQKRAGGVRKRVPARDMALGKGGWEGTTVNALPDAKHLDLFFFTLKEGRPLGHVGILLIMNRIWHLGHASSGRGQTVIDEIMLVPPFSWITEKLKLIRRI